MSTDTHGVYILVILINSIFRRKTQNIRLSYRSNSVGLFLPPTAFVLPVMPLGCRCRLRVGSISQFLDALPLFINKKLDLNALPDPTSQKHQVSRSTLDSLLSPLENSVAVALLEALNLPIEHAVTSETTDAELGGTSFASVIGTKASQPISQLQDQFGRGLSKENVHT